MTVKTLERIDLVDFLYREAHLLDEWKLKEWAALFTDDGTYKVPPLGEPDADAKQSLFYIHDDRKRIQDRAERLLKKEAHVEYPHSTTVRNYHNIMIDDLDSDVIKVNCNFTLHRTKREVVDTFIGRHTYDIVQQDGELRIKNKKSVLKLDSLRPHGKISLIL
ncbi:aromatic-ring-hydroxylating dioxygenase subunit beta [Lentibacillus amyloliquefaciens]|uniref:p-cumate dioxygenase n=1 Tax=Lentibacillus amyloliquefaciens TaxID=1472767 RepID=A0A0U4FIZ8_9BACI|nr:aromatic-ring-hydroxylating dioxygenase subunit beta [Lentibacillus amyloliquefaciens]ALX48606.1 p-cumate dioxygenase [Lentibacillus amyloliquefaciens]